MAPILYKDNSSPPACAVMMVAELIKLPLEFRDLNPVLREQDTPELTKINPMRTIPFLDDNGFHLADSHAIVLYLLEKYGKAEHKNLYPENNSIRATIHQRMFFDCGILFPRLRAIMAPTFFGKLSELSKNMKKNVDDAYRTLECYLNDNKYLAGNEMTVADLCVITTMCCLNGLHPIDQTRFPKTKIWLNEMCSKEICQKICVPGTGQLVMSLKTFMENSRENKSKL